MSRELSANEVALREIMKNIKSGIQFGKIHPCQDMIPTPHRQSPYYFETVLWYAYSEHFPNFGKPYIYWRHFGESAEKPTLQNLRWILKVIFKTSPSEFLMTYSTYGHYKSVTGNRY